MRDLINYDAFSILLVDRDARALRHLFSMRYDQRVNIDNVPLGKGLTGAAAEGISAALGEETQPTRAAQARDRVFVEPRERIAAQQILNGLRSAHRIGVGTAYALQFPQSRTLQTAPRIAPPGDRHRGQQNEHRAEAPPTRRRRPPSRRGGRMFRSQVGEPIGVHAANCNASSAAVSS